LLSERASSNVAASPHLAREPQAALIPGSEFIVKLPLAASPLATSQVLTEEPAPNPNGMRVLVVDDNIDQTTMLATALRMKGYAVQSAYSGPDGLRVAQRWRPDVVLLDVGLPGLDGYEVARRPSVRRMAARHSGGRLSP
jgi:PleD family two-component response regulator